MKDKILEPRYATPQEPLYERNYFFVALLLIISFFSYSMWILHQEAPTIPVVQEWKYYPRLTGGNRNVFIGTESGINVIYVASCDTLSLSSNTNTNSYSDTVWWQDMSKHAPSIMFPGKIYIDLQGMEIDEWRKLHQKEGN